MTIALRILAALIGATAPAASAVACTIRARPPLDYFNPTFYVFTGRVTGYVADGALRSKANTEVVRRPDGTSVQRVASWEPGWGVVIEVLNVVHAPRRRASYVVFPAGLDGACLPEYRTRERVEADYALGDTVAVVSEGETDRLGRPWGFSIGEQHGLPLTEWTRGGHVGRRSLPSGVYLGAWSADPDSAGPLDSFTRRHDDLYARWERVRQAAETAPDSLWEALSTRVAQIEDEMNVAGDRLHFEFRGDLARLEHEPFPSERVALLAKMRRYWWTLRSDQPFECSFTTLVHTYLPNVEDRRSLNRTLRASRLKPAASASGCRTSGRLGELAAERSR